MDNKRTIWFDFTNPPHVNLFKPLIKHFDSKYTIYSTARNFVETQKLLRNYGIDYNLTGSHAGRNKIKKLFNLIKRNINLYFNSPNFDLCISSSFEAQQVAWLKRKTSIMFDDNETAPNWLYTKFTSYLFSPDCIDVSKWKKQGINEKKIIQYPGFKEDIYLADYKPDKHFLENFPFNNYIVVRPENIYASYVGNNIESIVPSLVKKLTDLGYNIVFLPRYEIDKEYIKEQDNVFVPPNPLNGLDLCYHAEAVLTGAGTFAREAALLGVPAVSFFAGNNLLSVDKELIAKNKIFHSRNVNNIIEYLYSSKREIFDQEKSKKVQQFVINKIENILKV